MPSDTMTAEEYRRMLGLQVTRKPTHPEHDLQCYLCQLLDAHSIYYFAIPNGELRGKNAIHGKIIGDRLRKEGVKAGVADLQVLLEGGISIFIEMKAGKGRQSELQKTFERKVKSLGFNYIVLNSADKCDEFVRAITDKSCFEKMLQYFENF